MLYSRPDRNVSQKELDAMKNSESKKDFEGLFSKDPEAKQLFTLIFDNMVYCSKKKVCNQKDAVALLLQSVLNFDATE